MTKTLIVIFSICFDLGSMAQSVGLDTVYYQNYSINKSISVYDKQDLKKELKSIKKELKGDSNRHVNLYRLAVLSQFTSSGKINKRYGSSISLINEACKLNDTISEYRIVAAFINSEIEDYYHDEGSNTCEAIGIASELNPDKKYLDSYNYQYLYSRCFPKIVMDCPNLESTEVKTNREVNIVSGGYNAYYGHKMIRLTSEMVMIDDSFYPADKIDQFSKFVDSLELRSNTEFRSDHTLRLEQFPIFLQLMSINTDAIGKLAEASRRIECGYSVQTITVKEGVDILKFEFYIPSEQGYIGAKCENFLLRLGNIFE
ncbi:MAG: hypothetical protein HRT58_17690 [Crocinitomicaceae bacterium]|nr:hypothetical protein [Flavobacteriales bacterium]NQZ37505.1 hypothetical protein [Crocinitomicaceae bacterium]